MFNIEREQSRKSPFQTLTPFLAQQAVSDTPFGGLGNIFSKRKSGGSHSRGGRGGGRGRGGYRRR